MLLYTHQSLTLHYARTGQGRCTLLAFHGFGQNAVSFSKFLASLESRYTIYSFSWLPQNYTEPPSSATWQAWLTSFCQQEKISQFDLLGFSIGARWVWSLACLPTLPIKKVFLLAPDSVVPSLIYHLAVHHSVGRAIFKSLLQSPVFLRMLFSAYGFFTSKSTRRFLRQQIENASDRERIFRTWQQCSQLKATKRTLLLANEQQPKQWYFWLGTQDRIISNRSIKKLVEQLPNSAVYELYCNHWQVPITFKKTILKDPHPFI